MLAVPHQVPHDQQRPALGRRGSTLMCADPAPSGKLYAIDAAPMVGEERTFKGSDMGLTVPERDIPKIVEM